MTSSTELIFFLIFAIVALGALFQIIIIHSGEV
jgi:hypothetical protein